MATYARDSQETIVSVLVMAYNHERYIEKAIESILSQKVDFSIEIVVGEDFSTDRTRQLVLQAAFKNRGVFRLLLYNRNIGAHENQLALMRACKGKYIALLEGDDYWCDPLKLKTQIDFLETHLDYSMSFHQVLEKDGRKIKVSNFLEETNEKDFSINDLAARNFIHTPSVVYRKDSNLKFPEWFKESPVGDYIFHMLYAKQGSIRYFPAPMAVYRRHTSGIWSSQSSANALSKWIKVLDLLLNADFSPEIKSVLKKQRLTRITSYLEVVYFHDEEAYVVELQRFVKEDKEFANEWLVNYYPEMLRTLRRSRSHRIADKIKRLGQSFSSWKKRLS
jgi:glycosyltransferase involved in cell wall biosynthesis